MPNSQALAMRTLLTCFLTALVMFPPAGAERGFGPATAHAQGELRAEQVEDAINRASDFLLRQQRQNGSFGGFAGGGLSYDQTGLITLALLESGMEPQRPEMQKALTFLRGKKFDTTYEMSLQIMALCSGEPKLDLELIRSTADRLAALQITNGANNGLWGYSAARQDPDYSNTQFALLALYEADRALESFAVDAPQTLRDGTLWRRALIGLRAGANRTAGGWAYQLSGGTSYGSMTAAGISSMIICLDRLGEGGVQITGGQVNCCGAPLDDPDLNRGMEWMARNFDWTTNPGHGLWYFYYMYGIERVGRLTAQRFFGEHDWYRVGTRFMISPDVQQPTGDFLSPTPNERAFPAANTAMALMFLSKGRRPVLFAQLKYGNGPADWNNRPSAFAQMARHVEDKWKRTLTWQIYESHGATVDSYRQAPVLFISGRAPLDFDDQTIEELVKYVNEGGTLFFERACDNAESGFQESLTNVLGRMFPGNSELRPLPLDHPVWAQDDPPEPKIYMGLDPQQGGNRPHLFALRSGCRDAVFYCDMDLSCYWELARKRLRQDIPEDIAQRVDEALKVGHNVLSYATGRQLKFKYEIPEKIDDNRLAQFADRVAINIAEARHDGDWTAAPAALVQIQRELHKETGIPIPLDESQVNLDSEDLFKHPILFFHGRSGFSLNDKERENLREYVRRGGYIFGDAVCASEAFAESFRKEMQTIFGEEPRQIPQEHALFTEKYGGFNLESVTRLEPPAAGVQGRREMTRRQVPPDLEGIFTDERYAVIFSRFDLSCALESAQSVPDCRGYERKDAAKIAINIILYALYE